MAWGEIVDRPDNKIVIGKTGSGKTVKTRNLIRDAKRLLIFDTLGHDYKDGVVFESVESLKRFWLNCYKGNFRIIYRPLDDLPEFRQICDLVYLCGNLYFVVEEMDLFFSANSQSIEARNILRRGRHKGIHFVGVTQRPIGIDRNTTAQATEAYIFRTDEPRDVDFIKARFGDDTAGLLSQLKPYEYVHIYPDNTKRIEKDVL